MLDVLVIGAGPAGLALATTLGDAGLRVGGLAPAAPDTPWSPTYGVWVDELDGLGLETLLARRWSNCVVYSGVRAHPLARDYGLFDNHRLQDHLLARAARAQVTWQRGHAARAVHHATHTEVTTQAGTTLAARLVVDASGHTPALVARPQRAHVAYQAAYGVAGHFSAPPVARRQMVLMDYRGDHLSPAQRAEPPSFLYAMDLGEGRYFVEETSLAHAPALPLALLEQRLHQRLAHRGIRIDQVDQVERCLFPMNLPLPDPRQPLLAFGGAASMVHPATGYQVGIALRRAPEVAQALVRGLDQGIHTPQGLAQIGWEAIWSQARVQRRDLYLFGLETLLRLNLSQTQEFFAAFFALPPEQWSGYLSDTLSTAELRQTMLRLFGHAPWRVRAALVRSAVGNGIHLWRALSG